MRIRARAVAAAVGGALASAMTALSFGAARWNRETLRIARGIDRTVASASDCEVSPRELAGLPVPAARYFRFALATSQRHIRHARIVHHGELQSTPGEWHAFTSVQHVSVRPPGFVWDASIHVAPLLSVHVRDAYLDGAGTMRASAAAVWTMMDRHGSPELAQAALQRWLGEAVWLPTALLPDAGVRWEPVDARSARATIVDHGITASLLFHFGPSGAIESCSGDRYQDTSDGATLTPWEGRFGRYACLDGMMIPMRGDAAWLGPRGRAPYWRGRITSVDYDVGGYAGD